MVATVEERLAQVEARLNEGEERLDQSRKDRIASLEARVSDIEESLGHTQPPRIGVTIEEVRAKVGRPVERGPEQFERLHRIFGRFSGPEDLSSRMRDYLNGDRE